MMRESETWRGRHSYKIRRSVAVFLMGLLFSARMEDGIVTAAAPPKTPPCAAARSGDLGDEINGFVNTGDDGNSTNRDSPENSAIDRKNSPDGEEKIESEEPSVKKVKFSEDTAVEEDAERKVVELQNGKLSSNKSSKKSKKKSKDIWSSTSKKSRKKNKTSANSNHNSNGNADDDKVLITPIAKFPDKSDDSAEMTICLSKAYKAEKIELSEDRLTASSTKGYRMVRATRGVKGGAWYFEIKVVHLGESGHTRLGWSTQKGDLQAPVGYDDNSYGYRDVDGSKVHKSLRVNYAGEGYKEGDVIGFYINLPNGASYAPDPPRFVWYKGQRYACASDEKDDPPKVVPGSEILFFKNGVSQGVAFEDLHGGLYYPAASMYTLPNQPNCVVKFNFGPDFEAFPVDFNGHPQPRPMFEVPYQGYQAPIKNGVSNEKST